MGIKILPSGCLGFTISNLHTIFDEVPNYIARCGPIRPFGTKIFEQFVKNLRSPASTHGTVQHPEFYSKVTQMFADKTAVVLAVENNMLS